MNKTTAQDIFLSFISAFVFLLWKGYLFNTTDTVEPLLLVYKKLNPALYAQDFYVEAAQGVFTVRYYFVELIVMLAKVFDVSTIAFVGTFASLFFGFWGIIRLVRELTEKTEVAYLSVFFISFFFLSWTVGGNVLHYHLFISSAIAKPLSIWGLYYLLRQRYALSAILIGLAGLFQVLVSLQLALIILAVLVLMRLWKPTFRWGAFWLIAISPMLLPILYRQFFMPAQDSIETERFYEILYFFRNPQHYMPSLFPAKDYLKLSLVSILGLSSLLYFLPSRRKIQVALFALIIIMGVGVYTVSLELLGIYSIGKLQWFKTTIWLTALAAMGIALAVNFVLSKLFKPLHIYVLACLLPIALLFKDAYLYDQPIALNHASSEQKELQEIHHWIRENTPLQALFSTLVQDESFGCESQRSQTVSLNPMIHEPWFIVQWYERFHLQYGVSDTIHSLTEMRVQADLYYNSGAWLDDISPDYSLVHRNADIPGTTIYQTRNFKLVQLGQYVN